MNKIIAENLPIITGNKVKLRPITHDDTPLIIKWRNSPSVKKNFIFRDELTEQMHTAWMENKVKTGEVIQYIIEDLESSLPVGSVYIRDIDTENESGEYGIFIGEDSARGKGLGSETAKLFTDFALYQLGFHRISLRVIASNASAYRSYINAGFEVEGTFRDMEKLDGEFCDIVFMARLSEN